MKSKLSEHQRRQVDAGTGHDVTADDADKIMVDPIAIEVQQDDRVATWGKLRGNIYKVVTSAATSAGTMIQRVVTGHRHRGPYA